MLRNKETRSKSFNCEKDLQLSSSSASPIKKRSKMIQTKPSSRPNKKGSKEDSSSSFSSQLFSLESTIKNLHFIDDEDAQVSSVSSASSTQQAKRLSSDQSDKDNENDVVDDDYDDDRVIYEGTDSENNDEMQQNDDYLIDQDFAKLADESNHLLNFDVSLDETETEERAAYGHEMSFMTAK